MENVTETVKKSAQDAAYIAVGVGVLGAQQAQSRAGEAKVKIESTAKGVAKDASAAAGSGATSARERLEAFAHDVRERVEPVIARIEERVEPIIGEVEARVEPVIDQVVSTAKSIAATGTAKARAFLGKDDTTKTKAKATATA